jgi:hypothetical protein
MRLALLLLLIWAAATLFWLQYLVGTWHDVVDANRAQLAALDACEPLFPPKADGYASLYGKSWSSWLANERQSHPDCAPLVGRIGFLNFVQMQQADRLALRQKLQRDDDQFTRFAFRAGWIAPLALLALIAALGLAAGHILRR